MDGDLFDDISVDDSSWTMRKFDSLLRALQSQAHVTEDDVLNIELEKLSYICRLHNLVTLDNVTHDLLEHGS